MSGRPDERVVIGAAESAATVEGLQHLDAHARLVTVDLGHEHVREMVREGDLLSNDCAAATIASTRACSPTAWPT
jgi:hypothetical protein